MLRTIFTIGLFTLLGIFALKLAFGIFGFAFGLLGWLIGKAIVIAILGAIGYVVLRIVAPETARRLTSRSNL